MTSCVPQVNHEVNKYDSVKRFPVSREFPVSSNTSSNHTPGMSSYTHVINRSRDYQPMEDEQVDLVYITERIISMSFQSDGQESLYQSNVQEVFHMLRMKHGENVLVINISEPRDDLQKANNQRVIDYGWPDHIAPPLERLCNICKSIDSWLNSDPNHVILLHCKGGRARLGVIIAAFMHYSSICASSDQAMDRMAMNRFFEGKLGGLSYPSHQRYVQYFSGLLSSAIKINSNPLYLHHLVIHGVPNFDSRGGCRPFIKVYQGMQPIFTSGVYNVTDQMQKVCISISPGIPLRGDIMIKCYHKNAASGQREPIWRCQFHTCAISNYNLLFSKSELDDAINDPRFPDQGKVEFVFGPNQDANVPVLDFKSDVTVPVDDNTDGLVRWDSYENFKHVDGYTKTDDINHNGIQRLPRMQHSEGPVDGGLYATVNKRKHEFVREEVVMHNGTQYNGSPHTSSDSGISAHSGIIGNSTHSPQYMQNDSRTQKNYSSVNSDSRQYGSHNYSTSSSTKQTVPPLDEQTQLDNILSDLLNDQVFVTSPRSGSSTMSKETRTFRTYETQRGPDGKTINQSAEVTYKLPSEVKEERHYTIKTEKDSKSSYMPTNAFSYTPTSPELARKVDSPKTSTLPYRTDYDNRYHKETSYSYNTVDGRSVSDSDNSWLQQQQRKLREKKDVRDDQRVQQEKKLVEELRTAQNRYLTKRAKSEEEERNVMDSYNTVSNGPSSTSPPGYSYSMSRSHTYSSEKSPGSFSSGKFEESRTTSERSEKVDHEANRLEELEKSLKAASNSIIATQQPWQQSVSPTGGFTQEHVVTRRTETRKYETNYQQQQQAVSAHHDNERHGNGHQSPVWDNYTSHVNVTQIQRPPSPPHQTRTVEEDRFSLRPIGPGMQALEPEGSPSSVGTLNRSTTPSFPISPVASAEQLIQSVHERVRRMSMGSMQDLSTVTPPFPVTPRTPYVNPGNQQTLQKQTQQTQQQQQFQYQTQQQQHFQTTQQYQTHHQTESMTHNGGPLHVDTSPRMLSSGTMSRSPGSTHSPETLSSLRQQLNVANSMSTGALSPGTHSMTGQSSPSVYFGLSRRGSLTSIADSVDATHATPRFVKDTSKFWYKPNITREEAIQLLKDKAPGTFVVRDSNSFPGAFGLALKVATIPPNVQTKSTGDPAADLVRHFLIEPTPKGVRLRGCNNEPVFGSLASLVYQHSLTPLALPCKLSLPEVDSSLDTSTMDSSVTSEIPSSAAALLAQGAACNVLYLNSVDTESLTGPQAVSKAIKQTLDTQPQIKQTVVHFKVSNQGITLTDNQRKLFFRRHYPVATVTYCGMDPDGRKIFGFVARKQGGVSDNACHLFAELDPEQPASAIVNFVTKVMIGQGKVKS